MRNYWEEYYSNKPLDEIPWQRTQADWFKHTVDSGLIKGENALDLGCGMGKKSIYLAEHGFNMVVGIDISKSAIKYAKRNAQEAEVKGVEFIAHDITDLSFLGDEKFDFVLDWAALHCIDEKIIPKYISEVTSHTKIGGLLMLRVFSSHGQDKDYFIDEINGQKSKVTLFSKEKIENLYLKDFEITQFNRSKPRTRTRLYLDEYLFNKKSN